MLRPATERSTSAVCWPRSGGGRAAVRGVPSNWTGFPTRRSGPTEGWVALDHHSARPELRTAKDFRDAAHASDRNAGLAERRFPGRHRAGAEERFEQGAQFGAAAHPVRVSGELGAVELGRGGGAEPLPGGVVPHAHDHMAVRRLEAFVGV